MHNISNDEIMGGVEKDKKSRSGHPRKTSQKKRRRSKNLRARMAMRASMTGVTKASSDGGSKTTIPKLVPSTSTA